MPFQFGAREPTRHDERVSSPFLLTIREGVTEAEVGQVISRLPRSTSASADNELGVLVVRWGPGSDVDTKNESHRLLSESGLFVAGPGSEEAVRRYLPHDDRPPSWAMWEESRGWFVMCERCKWSRKYATRSDAEVDTKRHDREVHGAP